MSNNQNIYKISSTAELSILNPEMATYNNKHWLLSHIRNSFISTDDTGMCETLMLSEDLPRLLAQKSKMRSQIPKPQEDFCCYPGLDQSDDEEEDNLWPSMEIHTDLGVSYFHRSNTVQKLEKLSLARKKASKIKNVRCDITPPPGVNNQNIFVRKEVKGKVQNTASLLGDQLAKCPVQSMNKFLAYSQFDGTYQSMPTKKIKIFLTMLPEESRNYPLEVCVIASAKIHEFIGLICYLCSIQYPDQVLLTVKNYGLYIAEGDGEIDTDFPPLDAREPCSKFCFSHLALIERRNSDIKMDVRTLSLTSDAESDIEHILSDTSRISTQQSEDLARMVSQQQLMEAPLYRSYRLKILTKGLFKADIQLGISGEKLEIDPVQTQNSKFWSRQKAIHHNMDSIVWCEIIDDSSVHRVCFRIVYNYTPTVDGGQPSPVQHSNTSFRHYDFLTDAVLAKEIVEKVNHILDVRSSELRREYLSNYARSDVRKKLKKKTFLFK